MKRIHAILTAVVLVCSASNAQALDAEQKCQAGRAKAKGGYELCLSKVLAKLAGPSSIGGEDFEKLLKCVDKYAATWTKLQALAGSASCGGLDRFVDNGTTVTDRLTLLTWEKKTSAADFTPNMSEPHDPDNGYALNFDNDDDGSAYSDFLEKLNDGTGFADANAWRLPTMAELLTIRGRAEVGFNTFGPLWTTSVDGTDAGRAWRVHPTDALALATEKWAVNSVRAVRGGL